MASSSQLNMDSSSQPSKPRGNTIFFPGAIIVGAGPSGLSVAASLHQFSIPYLILERSHCIAPLWQLQSYDRLKLHIPKHLCNLPFQNFPKNFPKYPSKYEFIAYLESYAKNFSIQPRFGQTVLKAEVDSTNNNVWRVETQDTVYFSSWLIVAAGENANPYVPEIRGLENFRGAVLHTIKYKSALGYEGKSILVIGCGNSGMDVSLDLADCHAWPHMVIRNTVHILPLEVFGISTFTVGMVLSRWLDVKTVDKIVLKLSNLILGDTEKLGIRRPEMGPFELKSVTGRSPVLDVGALKQIKSDKIKVMGEVEEITRDGAIFADGQVKEFDAIILATGYRSNVPTWLKDSDFFTAEGMPKAPFPNGWKGENGLYAVGFTRRGLSGAASDAVKVAQDIACQWRLKFNDG